MGRKVTKNQLKRK